MAAKKVTRYRNPILWESWSPAFMRHRAPMLERWWRRGYNRTPPVPYKDWELGPGEYLCMSIGCSDPVWYVEYIFYKNDVEKFCYCEKCCPRGDGRAFQFGLTDR